MQEKINADTILDYLKNATEQKLHLNTDLWMDAAFKLNSLLGDEQYKLYTLQKEVADIKLTALQEYTDGNGKRNVSEAKLRTESTETYMKYQIQKAKCARIEEFIRIAKLQAKISSGM